MPKTARQQFLEAFEREHQRSMRVLRAYPDEQSDFKPHERSRSAREVAWPIVLGQDRLMVKALTTWFDWSKPGAPPPSAPEKMSAIAEACDGAHSKAMGALNGADDSRFDATVSWPAGPGKLADVPVLQFLWFLLFDHIHHRGQLSVYLRMVGKVPAIYGPSGDETWT